MTTLMLWVAILAGALLIVAGVAGSRPRPADGRWVSMSPNLRAGLSMVGLVMILVGWAMLQGWFKLASGESAPRPYAAVRGERLPDTLWNEAEVAQREARIRAQTSGEPLPVESLPTPVAVVAEPAAVPIAKPVAPPPAAKAALPPPVAAPAPVATPPKAPQKKNLAARVSKEPDCDCDPAAPATAPSSRRSRNVGAAAALRSDTVSVCALQRQYGIVGP